MLLFDGDEDIRAGAALALYQTGRGSPRRERIMEVLTEVADDPRTCEYVREAAQSARAGIAEDAKTEPPK